MDLHLHELSSYKTLIQNRYNYEESWLVLQSLPLDRPAELLYSRVWENKEAEEYSETETFSLFSDISWWKVFTP